MNEQTRVTDLALQGQILPTVMRPGDPRNDPLRELTEVWLTRLASHHSRIAYKRDLGDWVSWCVQHGLHPLDARMSDVDKWIAMQREHGMGRTAVIRRYPDRAKLNDGEVRALYARWKAKEATQAELAAEAGVKQASLSRRFQRLAAAGAATGPSASPSSAASIARRVYAVRAWYDYLILNTAGDPVPLIGHNPAKTKATPKVNKGDSPTVALSRAEADLLIGAADTDGPRSRAIIRFMLTNADRRGTLSTIQVTDLSHDQGHRVLNRVIKGRRKVSDPVPPPTAEAIDAYLAWRGNPKEGPLFVTRTGRPIDGNYVYHLVRRLAKKAGIPGWDKISPHSLRATAITETHEVTGDLVLAMELAHHSHTDTTMIYIKRRGQLDRHAAYILAGRYGVRQEQSHE